MSIKQILLMDAVTCALMGAVLVAAASPLAAILGLPANLIWYAGLVLFPIALFMAVVSAPSRPPLAGVWLVVIGNWAWVAASIVLLYVCNPNALGIGFVLLQAIVVGAFAVAEQKAAKSALTDTRILQ